MTTPHPEQPAEGSDDVPADDPGDDDAAVVEEPGALEI